MRESISLELGIVSDEISNDFAEAMRHASAWGISLMEIRLLKSGRVPNVTQADFDEVQRYIADRKVRITALSPGIFKHSLSKTAELEHEITDVLPRTIEMARSFGCGMIIIFGFQREAEEN